MDAATAPGRPAAASVSLQRGLLASATGQTESIEDQLARDAAGRRMTLVPAEGGIMRVPNPAALSAATESDIGPAPPKSPRDPAGSASLTERWNLPADAWPKLVEKPVVLPAQPAMGQRELELLSEHVNLLTSKLRLGSDLSQLKLVADDSLAELDEDQDEENVHSLSLGQLNTRAVAPPIGHASHSTNSLAIDPNLSAFHDTLATGTLAQSSSLTRRGSNGVISRTNAEYARPKNDQAAPLPNGAMPHNHLINALKAHTQLTPNVVRKWRHHLISDVSQRLMIDSFWYVFLRQWHPQKQDEIDHLVRIAAADYVSLFLRFKGDDKDGFFQACALPELYAQSIYTAFRECFSQSHKAFDAQFQTSLCDMLFHLFSGIIPFNPACQHWPAEITSSKIGRRADDAEETTTMRTQRRGNYVGVGIQTKRVNFNIYQNSPIVERYLRSLGVSQDKRIVTIHRREAIVTESTKGSKRSFKMYKQLQEEALRERNRVAQEMSAHLLEEQRRALRILSRPQEVKNAADQILEVYASREASRRENRKKSMSTPLHRASMFGVAVE
nr:hypothetical protein HK105_001414 [Polyrhizophydium stewartii]